MRSDNHGNHANIPYSNQKRRRRAVAHRIRFRHPRNTLDRPQRITRRCATIPSTFNAIWPVTVAYFNLYQGISK